VVFIANHLTDTDRQNSTGKYANYVQFKKQTTYNTEKTTLVQSTLTTLGQETRWAYCSPFLSPHGAYLEKIITSVQSMHDLFHPQLYNARK